tara:strand:- start:336 stop:1043 length:708 start_codon:yes stop_codon:yes gene_type:complete
MGQIKHKMGNVGGGVDISHKSKMSNAAKNQMSFPDGMPGPGDYGQMEQPAKIVGKGMARYLAGESVGMRKMDAMYSGGPNKAASDVKKEGKRNADGTLMSPRQLKLAQEKEDEKKKNSDIINKPFKGGKLDVSKSKETESSSKTDMEKIQESKKNKIKAGKDKKAEGQSDLKKARETKFISRGSGEDSGVSTREERRTAIRAARQKKREGRRAERKARKGTVIKQKSVRIKKSDD